MPAQTTVPIFYYHSIGGPGPRTLPLDLFRRQLDFLLEENYVTISFRDLLKRKVVEPAADPTSPRYAVLTFDDGLLDNFENAYPELKGRGMTGTFFVVPGFDKITRYVNPVTRKWSQGSRPGYTIAFRSMTSEHRRALVDDDMEIGCHTMTHRRLTKIPPRDRGAEIVESKLFLESELGTSVDTFCYPYGRLSRDIVERVKRAGYLGAATTFPGYESPAPGRPYRCKRFLIHNPCYFREILRGNAFSPMAFGRAARAYGQWRFFQ